MGLGQGVLEPVALDRMDGAQVGRKLLRRLRRSRPDQEALDLSAVPLGQLLRRGQRR